MRQEWTSQKKLLNADCGFYHTFRVSPTFYYVDNWLRILRGVNKFNRIRVEQLEKAESPVCFFAMRP